MTKKYILFAQNSNWKKKEENQLDKKTFHYIMKET